MTTDGYELVALVMDVLKKKKFAIDNEKQVQADIASHLQKHNIGHVREFPLTKKDIPDFKLNEGLFVEVKIKGGKMEIYRQCERYCNHPDVAGLILITNRMTALPVRINNKPVYVINLSTSWL
jgi:hypothetical protein